jgi:hypothetical protein
LAALVGHREQPLDRERVAVEENHRS